MQIVKNPIFQKYLSFFSSSPELFEVNALRPASIVSIKKVCTLFPFYSGVEAYCTRLLSSEGGYHAVPYFLIIPVKFNLCGTSD